jgi:hypothetical protein
MTLPHAGPYGAPLMSAARGPQHHVAGLQYPAGVVCGSGASGGNEEGE